MTSRKLVSIKHYFQDIGLVIVLQFHHILTFWSPHAGFG
jgi:hypothetical protein